MKYNIVFVGLTKLRPDECIIIVFLIKSISHKIFGSDIVHSNYRCNNNRS